MTKSLFNKLQSAQVRTGTMGRLYWKLAFSAIGLVQQVEKETMLAARGFIAKPAPYGLEVMKTASERLGETMQQLGALEAEMLTRAQSVKDCPPSWEEIVTRWIAGKPAVVSEDIANLRAEAMGCTVAEAKKQMTTTAIQMQARREEKAMRLLTELESHAALAYDYPEIGDILTDDVVSDIAPEVIKGILRFWSQYNAWDDTELLLIREDQKTLGM